MFMLVHTQKRRNVVGEGRKRDRERDGSRMNIFRNN